MKRSDPKHPGRKLEEEYLLPLELSQSELARGVGIPNSRVNEIVVGKRGITAQTAVRLGEYFKEPAEKFLAWQTDYEMQLAIKEYKASNTKVKPFSGRAKKT